MIPHLHVEVGQADWNEEDNNCWSKHDDEHEIHDIVTKTTDVARQTAAQSVHGADILRESADDSTCG